MATSSKQRELDWSGFPPVAVKKFSTSVCLACVFDIFTKQLNLGPRTAYSEVKRHTPSVKELTSLEASRPYFHSQEKNPRCPYCNSAKRWHAKLDTYRIEGGKTTDAPRRAFVKSLPKTGDQFVVLEQKSTGQAIFFEWLDGLGRTLNFDDDAWLPEVTRSYLERREPKTDWAEVFDGLRAVRPSNRIETGWERDGDRLFLSPPLYNEVLLVQYLVSRSHKAGGRTFQGRLTLVELLRRFRYSGFLKAQGVTEQDQFEILEKLVEHITGGEDAAKLHFIVDRREFLERLKTVYAHYAS